jgi:Fe-S oxidoreductase
MSGRVRDVTEILSASSLAPTMEPAGEALRVTFHDPCHLSRHQKLSQAAREALRLLPGIEFIEMKEADWCCGGAGAFSVEYPDLSLQILERKVRNIEESGARIVATTCPACMMQLQSGLRQSGAAARRLVQVKHLVELARD